MGALVLTGLPASAQLANPADFPLLAPSLDGNPRNPPVFRKAKPLVADPTTPGGPPQNFGYEPGMGAGSTGFNSSNVRPKIRGSSSTLPGTASPGSAANAQAAPEAKP